MVAAAVFTGCTMKNQEAPPLTGPSEFGLSVTLTASPDILTQDGASQSSINITALDANGQPARNLSLRAEILVGFMPVDFGRLSARNVVTDSTGRAALVYTAPLGSAVGVDTGTVVTITATPIGTDFSNSTPRFVSIRLVPPGAVIPPDGLQPRFTFTPSAPDDHQPVLFDASTSEAPPNNPIVRYEWNFGDGRGTAAGATTSYSYRDPGTYIVTLTVFDAFNRAASTSQSITVGAGTGPTASFTFSPTEPLPNQQVNFNAAASTAAPGRRLVSYEWNFGDGTANATGVQVAHTYPAIGTYVVTLTVTDDVGRRATVTKNVPVKLPDEEGFTSGSGGS